MAIDPKIEIMLDEEAGYTIPEDETAEADPVMVASLGGAFGRRAYRLFGKSTRKTMERVKTKQIERHRGPSPDELDEMLGRFDARYGSEMDEATAMRYQSDWEAQPLPEERRTPERINIERHIQGARADIENVQRLMDNPVAAIGQMQTADDMAKFLEVAGRHQKLAEAPRTHESIREATEGGKSLEVLREALKIEGGGLLNDVQLHAARRMLSTTGDKTVEMARQLRALKRGNQPIPADMMLAYQQNLETFTSLHAFVKGQAREVARALSQQRMISQTLRGQGMEEMATLVKGLGGQDDILRHAEVVADVDTGSETSMIKGLSEKGGAWARTGLGLAVEWWKSNILSGPQTHMVNTLSNSLTQLYEAGLVRGVAAGIGEARYVAGRALGIDVKDRVSLQEYIAGGMAGAVGIADGLEGFYRTLRTGESYFADIGSRGGKSEMVGMSGEWQTLGKNIGERVGGGRGGELGHAAGTGMTFSFRMLESEDEFFKVWAFRQELTRLAVRDGYSRGLEGDDLTRHIDDVFDDPDHYGLLKPAEDYARMVTFTDRDVGGLAGSIMDSARLITEQHPYLQFVVPFIKTPVNLVRYALDTTGIPVTKRMRGQLLAGGAQRDIAMAKMGIGAGITVGAYQLYEAGILTGSGPDDPATRSLWEKAGWKKSAIKLGDEWYSYDRTDPFGTVLGAMADYFDRARYSATEDEFRKYVMSAVFTVSDHTFDATYMRGVNEFFQVMSGRRSAESWLSNLAVPMVKPLAMAQKTAVKMERGPERTGVDDITRGLGNQYQQRRRMYTPGLDPAEWPRPARYWDASAVIPREGEVGYEAANDLVFFGLSPIQRRKAESDPLSQEIAFNGVRVGEPSSMFTTPGSRTQFSLYALDEGRGRLYDEYFKIAGALRREYVGKLVESGAYQRNRDKPGFRGEESVATGEIRSLIMKADRDARDLFLYGKPGQKPELWRLLNEKKMYGIPLAHQIANSMIEVDKDIYRGLTTQDDLKGQAKVKKRGATGAPAPIQTVPEADRQVDGPRGPYF